MLRRHPQVCLIDGLAYRNPPGSKHPERWQDVEDLLAAGISVVTSINLQYVKERQAQVEAIRGKSGTGFRTRGLHPRCRRDRTGGCPAGVLRSGKRRRGCRNLSQQQHQLSQLREIALVLAADVVDQQLEAYLKRQGIEQLYGTQERILVCVTPRSNASLMIRRGRRQADLFHGDLYVVYVQQDVLSAADQQISSRIWQPPAPPTPTSRSCTGEDPIASILQFAHSHGITQIFVGHSQQAAAG